MKPSKETQAAHDRFMDLYVKDLQKIVGKCFYQKQEADPEYDDEEEMEESEGFMLIETVDDDGTISGTIVGFKGDEPVLMTGEIQQVDGDPCSRKEFLSALTRVQAMLAKKAQALMEEE